MFSIRVRLGEHSLNSEKDCSVEGVCAPNVQDFEVESIIRHPKFDAKTLDYDLGLFRLTEQVNFNSKSSPLCFTSDLFVFLNFLLT